MALRKIKNTYYVYYRDLDGKHKTRSLKTSDPIQAEKMERQYMALLQNRKSAAVLFRDFPEMKQAFPAPEAENRKKVNPDNGRLKLDDILPELNKIHPVSPTSERIIRRFVSTMKCKYADQVTPEMALQYLEERYSDGRNYKAFNNNKGVLNKAYRYLLVRIGLKESPFDRISNRAVKNVICHRPISSEEFLRIFTNSEEPYRTAACLGFYAGADMSTAFGLPGTAVYMEERIINWRRPKTGTKFICGIHDELYYMLKRLNIDHESDDPILNQVCSTYRNEYFRELFEKLGICDTEEGKASFHSFRTSFFTRCDEADLHRRTTSLAGGHVDDRQNDWYSHDISAAHEVEKLPSVGIPMGD